MIRPYAFVSNPTSISKKKETIQPNNTIIINKLQGKQTINTQANQAENKFRNTDKNCLKKATLTLNIKFFIKYYISNTNQGVLIGKRFKNQEIFSYL